MSLSKIKKLFWKLFAIVILLFFGRMSYATNVARCSDDLIRTNQDGHGRNAWCRKCGYIDAEEETFLNNKGKYCVFTRGRQPTSEAVSCESGLTIQAYCAIGCFAETERVLFDNFYLSLEEAFHADVDEVKAVDILGGELASTDAKIEQYVHGPTKEVLLRFHSEAGRTLTVTKNHPMVLADGSVRRADVIQPGDFLLDEDFRGDRVKGIESVLYVGTVWNLLLESDKKEHNLIFSEGLVTGTLKFQNQWEDVDFRLSLRNKIDVSNL